MGRFVAFVDGVLSLRARSDTAVERLEISLRLYPACGDEQLARRSAITAEGWIRYAVQHATTSFNLELRRIARERQCYWDDDDDEDSDDDDDSCKSGEKPLIGLKIDDLPSSATAKLETMSMALGGARLWLPATVAFGSLVDLTLKRINLAASNGRLLARLLSPACCRACRSFTCATSMGL
ncbi:hypothetical protein ACP70R_024222 [Stipagrostis hirtigluma subsp. patula]